MSEALEGFIAENGGARITTDSVSIDDIETAKVVEKNFADAGFFLLRTAAVSPKCASALPRDIALNICAQPSWSC